MSSSGDVDFYDHFHQQERLPPFLAKSNPYIPLATSEKADGFNPQTQLEDFDQSQCGSKACPHRRKCHSARLRRVLIPIVVSFALLLGVLVMGMSVCTRGKGMSWPGHGSGLWLGVGSDGTPEVAPSPPIDVPEGTIVAYRRHPAPEASPEPELDAATFLSSLASSLSSTSSNLADKRSADNAASPIAKRQSSGAPNNGTNDESSFTRRKLYLIVIFVGLFVVLVLAIMLSAWCCRSSFENPLCCPCYLCACCGGLACLECIGCGLCCEGVSELTD